MEKVIPISDLQSKAKRYVEQVRLTQEPVIITQHGRAAAILVSIERYEGHLATAELLRQPDWGKRWTRAELEMRSKKGIELETYKKKRGKRISNRKAA
jgi:prevent-host-death family protein